MISTRSSAVAAMILALMGPTPSDAQSASGQNGATAEATRAQLLEILERSEQAAATPDSSSRARERARLEAVRIRSRLDAGDFQPGDRVALDVVGEAELSDTFTVNTARAIELPVVGSIGLDGVLRSELGEHIADELERYLQNPRVQTTVLIRVAVLGAVGSQGFYTVPAGTLLEEALMIAGGPSGEADINGIVVRRGEEVVLEGRPLQQALIEGLTLDQIGLRAGDRIIVPEPTSRLGLLRVVLVTVPSMILLFLRLRGQL